MADRKPRGRRPADFNYPRSEADANSDLRWDKERDEISVSQRSEGFFFGWFDRSGSWLAISLLVFGFATGYWMHAIFGAERKSTVELDNLLRNAQLELKKASEINGRLQEAADKGVKLQKIEAEFNRLCLDDSTISELCPPPSSLPRKKNR
ncbi:MAG TPA: hypothetical protein VN838_06625 [Bradyrhizobium sp.]|nr:hypothetical protein [Bradyrhizobium sp.]